METHSVGRNPISFHPAKRPHLFRANVPPRLRHREFCELISKRVQADGIFEFPNVCYLQRMGRGSAGKIREIFFLFDAREVFRFFPNFIQRSRPNLAERETAVKNSIREETYMYTSLTSDFGTLLRNSAVLDPLNNRSAYCGFSESNRDLFIRWSIQNAIEKRHPAFSTPTIVRCGNSGYRIAEYRPT